MSQGQHIIGLRDGSWKATHPFFGHENLRLGRDISRREVQDQEPEKRKQSQSVKVSSERPGRSGTRKCRAGTLGWPRSGSQYAQGPVHWSRTHRAAPDTRHERAPLDYATGSSRNSSHHADPPPIPKHFQPCGGGHTDSCSLRNHQSVRGRCRRG